MDHFAREISGEETSTIVSLMDSLGDVWLGRKLSTFLEACPMDPPEGHLGAKPITPKRSLIPVLLAHTLYKGAVPSSRGNKYILVAVTNCLQRSCRNYGVSPSLHRISPTNKWASRGFCQSYGLKRILEKTIGETVCFLVLAITSDALWASPQLTKRYRVYLYKLVYGKDAISIELEHKAMGLETSNFYLSTAGDHRRKDYPDCEGSRTLGFVYSITRASNPQLHFGNPDILI
ncbi:hypothetical protein Tco_0441258 [Tanacetum coccineum]